MFCEKCFVLFLYMTVSTCNCGYSNILCSLRTVTGSVPEPTQWVSLLNRICFKWTAAGATKFYFFFYLSLAYTDFSKLYNRWWKSQSILDWDVLLWNCSKTNLFNLHNFSKFYPPVLLLNILHDTKSVPVQTGWLDVAFLCEACMFSLCLIGVSPNVKRNICYDCKRLESCPVCVSPSISPPWPLGGQAFKIEASVYIDILHSVPTFLETYLYNCKIVPLTVTLKQA